jgi:hypothetical protein
MVIMNDRCIDASLRLTGSRGLVSRRNPQIGKLRYRVWF